jgi:hypothetical protein
MPGGGKDIIDSQVDRRPSSHKRLKLSLRLYRQACSDQLVRCGEPGKRVASICDGKWWPILCGTATTVPAARATAINLGLLICDPGRLPLAVLVRAAGKPATDMHLPEALLQEIVRLGERALRPLQQRWPYRPNVREIGFSLDPWKDREIEDLLWLEDELRQPAGSI